MSKLSSVHLRTFNSTLRFCTCASGARSCSRVSIRVRGHVGVLTNEFARFASMLFSLSISGKETLSLAKPRSARTSTSGQTVNIT